MVYKKRCPVCTVKFLTKYREQKFCGQDCNEKYHERAIKQFGSMKKFKQWLDKDLINWKDFNEFSI